MKLLYMAYGGEDVYYQTFFSIVSALVHYESKDIIVYTDNKDFFRKLGITTQDLNAATMTERRGKDGYFFRSKICMIKDAFSYTEDDMIYMDSDSFIKRAFDITLDKEHSAFHMKEGKIGESWLSYKPLYAYSYKDLPPLDHSYMYNAGVIGIAKENAHLVDDVLEFTDYLSGRIESRMHEQLAFAYILQHHTSIQETDQSVFHYRHDKNMFAKQGLNITDILRAHFGNIDTQSVSELVEIARNTRFSDYVCQTSEYKYLNK